MQPNACPRCGDFAELVPYGRVAWCEACRRTATFDLTPVESLGGWQGVRQAATLVAQLGPLKFVPWLYLGVVALLSAALYLGTDLSPGTVSVVVTTLQNWVELCGATWLSSCALQTVESGRYDVREAWRSTLAALPMLCIVALIPSIPSLIFESGALLRPDYGFAHELLRMVVVYAICFVPAVAAQGEHHPLLASYFSFQLARSAEVRVLVLAVSFGAAHALAYFVARLVIADLTVDLLRPVNPERVVAWFRTAEQVGGWLIAIIQPYVVAYLLLASLKLRQTLEW